MGVAGFFFGYFIASIFTSLVDSSVITVYVLYVLYPDSFAKKHGKSQVYKNLKFAYEMNHPRFEIERERKPLLSSKEV